MRKRYHIHVKGEDVPPPMQVSALSAVADGMTGRIVACMHSWSDPPGGECNLRRSSQSCEKSGGSTTGSSPGLPSWGLWSPRPSSGKPSPC